MLEIILITLWAASAAADAAAFCALWQMKEYRFDRMRDFLSAKGYWVFGLTFLRHPLRFPKPTARSLSLLFLAVWAEVAVIILIGHWIIFPVLLFLRFYLFSAIALLSGIPVGMAKRWIIRSATKKLRQYPNLLVIGITGSYGKTSVKIILTHILSVAKRVIATPEHVNTDIGIAQFILKTNFTNRDVFVVEMGAYTRGEIQAICNMVKPTIGILTAMNEQHLSLFGSMKNIQTTKYELLRSLPKNGLAITNGDNILCTEFLSELAAPAELFYTQQDMQSTNIAPCRIVGKQLGMAEEAILERLKTLPLTTLRTQRYGRATIIDDSYNSNPDGFLAALSRLATFSGRKKIVVTRGMIELGEKSSALHEKIGNAIGGVADTLILIDRESENPLRRGVGVGKTDVVVQNNPDRLTAAIRSYKDTDSVILIENRIPIMLKNELGL